MKHGLLTVAACLAAFLAGQRAAAAQPEQTASERTMPHDADWKSASTVGAGVGLAGRYHGLEWPQTFLVSAQFPIARLVVVEATATRWSWHRDRRILMALADEHWRTSSVGANVLLRAGREKLTGSFGMGAGFQRSALLSSTCRLACETTTFASSAVRTSPSIQFAGGADVRLAPRLVAFASLLMIVGNEGGLATTAGVRIPITTPPARTPPIASPPRNPAASRGKQVRLTLTNGIRHTGRLVSFSATEVVILGDNELVRTPLTEVRKLEKTGYGGVIKGTLAGAAAGTYVGYAIGESSSPEDWLQPTLIFSSVGAGIGAGIGIVIDAARSGRNLIYETPGRRSIVATPLVSPTHAGAAVSVRW